MCIVSYQYLTVVSGFVIIVHEVVIIIIIVVVMFTIIVIITFRAINYTEWVLLWG